MDASRLPARFPRYSIFFIIIRWKLSYAESTQIAPFLRSSPTLSNFYFHAVSRGRWEAREQPWIEIATRATFLTNGIVRRNGGEWKIDRRFRFRSPARLLSPLSFLPPFFPSNFVPFHFWFFWFACKDRGWTARKKRKKRKEKKKRKREKKRKKRTGYIRPPGLPVVPLAPLSRQGATMEV